MPKTLTPDELAFVTRVQSYCAAGLNQMEMAERERLSLTGLRDRLRRCGVQIEVVCQRRLVPVAVDGRLAGLLGVGA
jgi:hypothetical protein